LRELGTHPLAIEKHAKGYLDTPLERAREGGASDWIRASFEKEPHGVSVPSLEDLQKWHSGWIGSML
jgi:hypothetical protein